MRSLLRYEEMSPAFLSARYVRDPFRLAPLKEISGASGFPWPGEGGGFSLYCSFWASHSIQEAEAKHRSLKRMVGLRRLLPYHLSWLEALALHLTWKKRKSNLHSNQTKPECRLNWRQRMKHKFHLQLSITRCMFLRVMQLGSPQNPLFKLIL